MTSSLIHPDRLFPSESRTLALSREIYRTTVSLPIISPHGHTDPAWFAQNESFTNPADLLITPDHYVFRMLYSQGLSLDDLGIPRADGSTDNPPPEAVWQLFADNYHLFRGTPTRVWLDHVFAEVFEIDEPLTSGTADHYYGVIDSALKTPEFRPRALFERFNIEFLATTESPLDTLPHHGALKNDSWPKETNRRIVTTFRPDPVLDPEFEGFAENLTELGRLTNEDTSTFAGYLRALENRRAFFREHGATATDHGHPTARTAWLDRADVEKLYDAARTGAINAPEAELFRAHMLTEMAGMSADDGMVMQIHPGSHRNHNQPLFDRYGRDRGADIPQTTNYVDALKPLLGRYGNNADLTIILFTLDETVYSRELAPLAGHYPALKLGPAWWFHDSPDGMRRFRRQVTETAGFYNTVGFNDDTRAFLSIPARHDLARRIDAGFLAELVVEHTLREDEAYELARLLAYDLAKDAYRI